LLNIPIKHDFVPPLIIKNHPWLLRDSATL